MRDKAEAEHGKNLLLLLLLQAWERETEGQGQRLTDWLFSGMQERWKVGCRGEVTRETRGGTHVHAWAAPARVTQ